MESNREPERARESQREPESKPERARESQRGPVRARQSQGEPESEPERAREGQSEPDSEPERLASHLQHASTLFCCKTVKYNSVLSRNVKIRYFCRETLKYAL